MSMNKKQQVAKYLTERPGMILYATDISKDTGINEGTVRGSISHLKMMGWQIDSPVRGAYKFVSDSSSKVTNTSGALFEKVGESKTGKLVLQDENGNLYVAEAL